MKKLPLWAIGFLQAAGLYIYCLLMGLLMWKEPTLGNSSTFFTASIILVLFATSALICAFITLAYPVYLIWKKKQVANALKLVGLTIVWALGLTVISISVVALIVG